MSDLIQYVIAYGTLEDGFKFIGPFDGREPLDAFLEAHPNTAKWVNKENDIIALDEPECY